MTTRPFNKPRVALVAACGVFAAAAAALAGPLNPPAGPVSSTGKTTQEIFDRAALAEPRTAINSTNTPGDANSRFRIVVPGSYYLTGNLNGVAGDAGIEIAASNVTIDLMGFALTGGVLTLDGITTDGVRDNITIRNGTITGWGSDGINLTTGGTGTGYRLEGITASDNGGMGIRLGGRAIVRSCLALSNGADGINATSNAAVVECIASLNGARGFFVSSGSTLTACTASNNTTDGFFLSASAIATNCTSIGNSGRGFFVGSSGVVNQCIATSNANHGIELFSRSVATNNTVSGNTSDADTAAGIICTGDSNRVWANHCGGNEDGIVVTGNFNTIIGNSCAGNNLHGIRTSGDSNRIDGNSSLDSGSNITTAGTRNFLTRNSASGGIGSFSIIASDNAQGPFADVVDTYSVAEWAAIPGSNHPWANFRH